MTSSRTFERWTTIAALFVVISQLPLLSWPARAALPVAPRPDALAR